MKRPSTPWQEKVGEYCRSYLEAYPEICQLLAQLPESTDLPSYMQSLSSTREVFKQVEEISRQRPELRKTKSIQLTPEFVRMMEEVPSLKGMVAFGEQEYPAAFAEILG